MIRLCAFADEYDTKLDVQIAGLKANGIRLIEIRSVDGVNVADLEEAAAQACYEKLKAAGIAVWAIGSPLGKVDIAEDFESYKKKIHHVCRLANIFHTDKIRMFSFFHAYDAPETVFIRLKEMVKIGREYGVSMYHENEKEIFGDTVERVLELKQHVPGLKFVYDPANFVQCKQDCRMAMEQLLDITDYFHIKDVDAVTDDLVPAGYGSGEIPRMVAHIDKDTVLTLEPHLAVFDGYSAIDNTQMKHKFCYDDNHQAFTAAVDALKALLMQNSYVEINGNYIKE